MNNVIQLLNRKNIDSVSPAPESRVTRAVTNVVASIAHSGRELSMLCDAIEHDIDRIDDMETRIRLKQSTESSRETLLRAMLQLTQQIGKLGGCCDA